MDISAPRIFRGALCALFGYGVVLAGWKVVGLEGWGVTLGLLSQVIATALTLFFFTGSLFRRQNPDKVRGARIFGIAVATAVICMVLSAAIGIATH